MIEVHSILKGSSAEITLTETTPCCGDGCCAENEADAAQDTELDAAAIKAVVREKYAEAARTPDAGCCGDGCCGDDLTMIDDEYEGIAGYVADADLGLGCGLPTEHAGIRAGDTVLDLGSGAGIDAFIARTLVGAEGRVLGVDMTPEMIARARANAEKLGFENVTFLQGEIEDLPLDAAVVDVVVSNCVLNLVPDKHRAFSEMHRVLRPGGRFCISDIVVRGDIPASLRRSASLYVGCVAGALEEAEYLALLEAAGFNEVTVVKEKPVQVPDEILQSLLTPEEHRTLLEKGTTLVSITVTGMKG